MTTLLEMGDSSTPASPPARLPAYAFYIGGDTPHVWTDREIAELDARYGLPIYTWTDNSRPAIEIANAIIKWLVEHRWAHGTAVAHDGESHVFGAWLAELDAYVKAAGYLLTHYESKGPVDGNPQTSGGRWVADWTGVPHMYPGALITQYASAGTTGLQWDSDLLDNALPLHELHPPVTHPIREVIVDCKVPVLGHGDTGAAVRRMQALLFAWNDHQLGAGQVDGIFGPVTASALGSFQRIYGITTDRGVCGAVTWERLIEG